jgi:hypothetical protein
MVLPMRKFSESRLALVAALFLGVACGQAGEDAQPIGGAINALPAPTVQPVQKVAVPPPPTEAVVPTDLDRVYDIEETKPLEGIDRVYDIEETKPLEGIDRVYDIEETKPRELSQTGTDRTLDPQQPKVVLPGASPGGKPQPKVKSYTPPPTPE